MLLTKLARQVIKKKWGNTRGKGNKQGILGKDQILINIK